MKKFVLLFVLFFAGCAGSDKLTQPSGFDPENVHTIGFQLTGIDGGELEAFRKQQLAEVSLEISRRFSQAGYSVSVTESSEPEKNFSHILEASVGASAFTETPKGFSFGLGNSDPRSSSFQKGVSTPITCTLRSKENSDQVMVLKEHKSVPSGINTLVLDADQQSQKKKRFYIENIGSTCHNLLSKLHILPASAGEVEPATRFAPVVRIETEIENTGEREDKRKDQRGSKSTTDFTQPTDIVEKSNEEAPAETVNQSKNTKPPVAVRNDQAEDWRNKTMKIFNQGDTVILKFGVERR